MVNEAGTSQADTIGLMAVGGQFGMAGLQAVDTTWQLAGGLTRPGLLLALAMADGQAVIGRMAALAVGRGRGSTAAVAFGLGRDAFDLEAAAIRFMLADDGFFTDPFVTVPVSQLAADGDVSVERTVTFTLEGSGSFRNFMAGVGATLVVEYLSNGMVRVSLVGNLRGGVDGRRFGLEGVEASAGPHGGVSWLLPNAYEASRLVAAFGPTSGISALARAADGAAPLPLPQRVTVGLTPVSIGGNVSQGNTTLASGTLEATGQVTSDALGHTFEYGVTAEGSSGLAGPVLDALPPDVRRQLPGEGVWPGGNLAEAGAGTSLSVRTDPTFDVQEISLSFEGSFGQGTGLSTGVAGAQSTAGERATVTVTLTREDLEAMGPEGRRVLDALARHRPDQAAAALQALGGDLVDHAEVDVERSDYVSVGGTVAANAGGTGLTVGGGVSIETARP